jgi:cation transport protein ChaC
MTAPPTDGHRLTRELLLGDGLARLIARLGPHIRVLSAAERRASLRAALAARPTPADGVWLFAYGSLIWNPTVRVAARQVVRAPGWHRAFCLSARIGRGTPENPGLLLGLREGGTCTGVALHVPEAGLEDELDVLWRREMITAAYVPRWLAVEDAAGAPCGTALAFTIDPEGSAYAGDLPESEIVRRLASASGELGSCAEYLFHTCAGLRAVGVHDTELERVALQVRALLAAADDQAVPAT